ncbi:metallophosphoesterase [Rhizobiaceae bacterium BDR2-2]|uniref:Metallophosphoesterase n=1 Tax=Ectorhizobium quercum TaxID=2965071 RepID=A0AAE3SWN1_9HYPH|nr:metallophosphoesterase family protein [Ectorhizobium quercum]MCX8998933.1 metallophosphoesterase [Ectorhizobium quercum]
MLIAILSDIHANREAFEACLDAAVKAGAERFVLLGDIVGYGADPAWCVDKARELAAAGALCVRGNHDEAVSGGTVSLNGAARAAIDWTRGKLDRNQIAFLAQLPLLIEDDDRIYVHADASSPERWRYVTDSACATLHFDATKQRVGFCGHVHVPALYTRAPQGRVTPFTPISQTPVPLLPQRRWLAVMGAVGQPRDGNPAAAFGLYETQASELRFMRTAYDLEAAAAKIRAAGLPERLAARLSAGR